MVTPSEFRQIAAHRWEYVLTPDDNTQTDMLITPTVEDLGFLQELGITTCSLDSFRVTLCPSAMEHYKKLDNFVHGFTLDLTVDEEAFKNGFRPTTVVAKGVSGKHMIFCLDQFEMQYFPNDDGTGELCMRSGITAYELVTTFTGIEYDFEMNTELLLTSPKTALSLRTSTDSLAPVRKAEISYAEVGFTRTII